MSFKKVQSQATALYSGIGAADVTMRVTPFPVDLDGNKLTMAAFGATPQITCDPRIRGSEEIIGFTGLTDNGDDTGTFTGLIRDLASSSLATPGTGKQHGAGAKVVISWNPQDVARVAALENDNTYSGQNIFNGFAPQTNTDPIAANDLTRLSYVQALVLGTLTTINVIVPGTAGATLAAGNSVYYDDSSNQWKKTDATSAATVDDVLLGIAQGAGTAGNPISGGVLLQGVDSNQSGLTDGQTQYASNTPGAISTSPGTISVVLGISKGTTQLYFAPRFNQQITANQLAAMAGGGNLGTPSSANKFETQNDTSATSANDKIVRGNASGKIDSSWIDTAALVATGSYTFGESITLGAPVYLKASDGLVYNATYSLGAETTYGYIGIALESGTVGQSKKVATIDGTIITGLSLPAASGSVASTIDQAFNPSVSYGDQIYTGVPSRYYLWKSGPLASNLEKIDIKMQIQGTGGGITTMVVRPVTMNAGNFTVGSSLPNTAVINAPVSGATNTFTFSSPNTITPNTWYAFQLGTASGSSSNYWQVGTNSSGNSFPFGCEDSNGSSNFSWGVGAWMNTYYTTFTRWTAGDNCWLSTSSGTIETNIPTGLPIGTILSASSILLNKPTYDKYIGTGTVTYSSTDPGIFSIPRNANRIVIESAVSTTVKHILDLKIGDNFPRTFRTASISTIFNAGYWPTSAMFGYLNGNMTSASVYFYK